jgi:transposase
MNRKERKLEPLRRYSEALKLEVLREIDSGRLTKTHACRKYGMGIGTLYNWIKKYGRLGLYHPQVKIYMPKEKDDIKKLKEENAKLKEALVQLELRNLVSEARVSVASDWLGMSEEEFKKKAGTNQPKNSGGKKGSA